MTTTKVGLFHFMLYPILFLHFIVYRSTLKLQTILHCSLTLWICRRHPSPNMTPLQPLTSISASPPESATSVRNRIDNEPRSSQEYARKLTIIVGTCIGSGSQCASMLRHFQDRRFLMFLSKSIHTDGVRASVVVRLSL